MLILNVNVKNNVKNEACLSHSPNTFLQMGAIIWIGEIIDGSIEKNI